jgi:hypothetical protein
MTRSELYSINLYLSYGIKFLSAEELVKLDNLLNKAKQEITKRMET